MTGDQSRNQTDRCEAAADPDSGKQWAQWRAGDIMGAFRAKLGAGSGASADV